MVFVTAGRAKRFLRSGAESYDIPCASSKSILIRTNQPQGAAIGRLRQWTRRANDKVTRTHAVADLFRRVEQVRDRADEVLLAEESEAAAAHLLLTIFLQSVRQFVQQRTIVVRGASAVGRSPFHHSREISVSGQGTIVCA
jgi:hypothetical protein